MNGHSIAFRPQTQKLEPPYETPLFTLAVKRLINDSSFSLVQYLSIVCCRVNWISSLFSFLFSPYFSAKLEQVLAMFPYTAQNPDELTFYKGSVINVVSKEGEWWKGEMNGQTGMFPSNYVQPLSDLNMGIKMFLGLVEMPFGLVYASFNLPKWQALKMTFFAP